MQLIRIAALAVLLLPRLARADVEAATNVTIFTEPSKNSAGLRVIHPQTEVSASTGAIGISAGYDLDIVSGATARVYGEGVDAVSGATFADTRHAARGGLSFDTASVTFAGSYSYGFENDYRSHTVTGSARADFAERNFSLGLAYTHNFDRVCDNPNTLAQGNADLQPLGTSEGCFVKDGGKAERKLSIDTFEPQLSWTATPLLLLSAGGALQVLQGFQSNPYRAVRISESRTVQERLPSERQRYAVFVRAAQALPPARSSLRLGGRLYRDSWDVRAVSADLEWMSYFGPGLVLGLRGRYHKQGGAAFYRDSEALLLEGPTGAYWTGDRELAPLSNLMAGALLTLIKAPPTDSASFYEEIELNLRFDVLFYRPSDKAPNLDRRYAHIAQIGLRVRF